MARGVAAATAVLATLCTGVDVAAAARDCVFPRDRDLARNLPLWTYIYKESGPKQWPNLTPRYLTCAGDEQSPIDLEAAASERVPDQFLHFWKERTAAGTKASLRSSPAGIEIHLSNLNLGAVGSGFPEKMKLQRILLKNPSEHTLDGKRFDLERQMWFAPWDDTHFANARTQEKTTADHGVCGTELLVISDLFQATGKLDPFLDSIRPYLTSFRDRELREIDIPPVVPDTYPAGDVYSYRGSIPFPPCTQSVHWIISRTVLPVTQAQLGLLTNPNETAGAFTTTNRNNRALQPVNGRRVARHGVFRPSRSEGFAELRTCPLREPGANGSMCPLYKHVQCDGSRGMMPPACPRDVAPPATGGSSSSNSGNSGSSGNDDSTPAPPTQIHYTKMSASNERLLMAVLILGVVEVLCLMLLVVVLSWRWGAPLVDLPMRLRPPPLAVSLAGYVPEEQDAEEDEEDEEGEEEESEEEEEA